MNTEDMVGPYKSKNEVIQKGQIDSRLWYNVHIKAGKSRILTTKKTEDGRPLTRKSYGEIGP